MTAPGITTQLLVCSLPARHLRIGDIIKTPDWGLREILDLWLDDHDVYLVFSGEERRDVYHAKSYVEVVVP